MKVFAQQVYFETPEVINGYGEKRFGEGNYKGDLINGLPHGYGELTLDSGVIRKGNWHAGKLHGYGESHRPDGSYYKGNYYQDRHHGHGEMKKKSGKRYEGNFYQGKPQGKGEWTVVKRIQVGY